MTTTERIRAILVKNYKLNAEHLTTDARLEALGIDSLGMAELMFSIEDEFGVTLPTEPRPIATFGDVINLIDELIAAKSANAAVLHNNSTATPSSTSALPAAQLAP
jgi:acyl carrier protein